MHGDQVVWEEDTPTRRAAGVVDVDVADCAGGRRLSLTLRLDKRAVANYPTTVFVGQ